MTEFEDFERGDGVVFVSEKCHSVEVVVSPTLRVGLQLQ